MSDRYLFIALQGGLLEPVAGGTARDLAALRLRRNCLDALRRFREADYRLVLLVDPAAADSRQTQEFVLGLLESQGLGFADIRRCRHDGGCDCALPGIGLVADYIAAPTPFESLGQQREVYFFAGARVKAVAYNAFLQGQFRHSDVRYSFDEIEPIVVQAWLGVVTQLFPNTELSYALHYQSAELSEGDADRDVFWGGVQLAHSF